MVLGLATYDEMIDKYSMVRISHGSHGRTKRFLFSLSRFSPMAILLPSHSFHLSGFFPQSAHSCAHMTERTFLCAYDRARTGNIVRACVNLFTHPLGAMFHCPSPMARAHRWRLQRAAARCNTTMSTATKKKTQPRESLPLFSETALRGWVH